MSHSGRHPTIPRTFLPDRHLLRLWLPFPMFQILDPLIFTEGIKTWISNVSLSKWMWCCFCIEEIPGQTGAGTSTFRPPQKHMTTMTLTGEFLCEYLISAWLQISHFSFWISHFSVMQYGEFSWRNKEWGDLSAQLTRLLQIGFWPYWIIFVICLHIFRPGNFALKNASICNKNCLTTKQSKFATQIAQ